MAKAASSESGVQETITERHPTTNTFRSESARLCILGQCRQLSDDIQFGQSRAHRLYPCVIQVPYPSLVVQFVVAVEEERAGELWDCNASPRREQIYITSDGMFRIVPEVSPYAWILSRKVDFRNRPLPSYAGNLAFLLPIEHDTPMEYDITIKLCQGKRDNNTVLDLVKFFVKTHHKDTTLLDYQSGRTIREIEKPLPKIRMSGVLASKVGQAIVMHFQSLGDNGQYNQFLVDKRKLIDRVDGINKYQDLLLAVMLEEGISLFGQNRMQDCLTTCTDVSKRLNGCNSGNWPFLQSKANYIISAIYRQAKEFDLAEEYMENSTQCLETACLSEETAVNRYNKAALLAEKAAAVGLTPEEAQAADQLFKDAVWFWKQQQENGSMRCPIRTYNREITYHLKTSRQSFPDLRRNITREDIAKATRAIEDVEKNLLSRCPKRLKATFLIGKADLFIRKATIEGAGVTEQERLEDFDRAVTVLNEAKEISRALKMQKEIDGIDDRMHNIRQILARGVQKTPLIQVQRNEPCERNTDDIDDLINNLALDE